MSDVSEVRFPVFRSFIVDAGYFMLLVGVGTDTMLRIVGV